MQAVEQSDHSDIYIGIERLFQQGGSLASSLKVDLDQLGAPLRLIGREAAVDLGTAFSGALLGDFVGVRRGRTYGSKATRRWIDIEGQKAEREVIARHYPSYRAWLTEILSLVANISIAKPGLMAPGNSQPLLSEIKRAEKLQNLEARIRHVLTELEHLRIHDLVWNSMLPARPAPKQTRQSIGLQNGPRKKASAERRSPRLAVTVIQPDRPFSNRAALRDVLRSAEGYIVWIDRHFSARGLEEIASAADEIAVKYVAILSGSANINDRARRDFQHFRHELQGRGITAEWHVMETPGPSVHDRFIVSQHAVYNVPPINSLLKGDYAENLTDSQSSTVRGMVGWFAASRALISPGR